MTDDIVIRPATLDDRSFIIDSWLRSYRNSEFGRRIPDDVWGSRYGHGGFVEDVLMRGLLAVAALRSDPSFLFGFVASTGAVYGPPAFEVLTAHYVYVKKDYRRNGVGIRLARTVALDAMKIAVTADTPAWRGFAKKHGISYEYIHPYRKDRR